MEDFHLKLLIIYICLKKKIKKTKDNILIIRELLLMTTEVIDNKTILEKTRKLLEPLKDIGLAALPYAKGPLGPAVFTMGLGPDAEVIRFWAGGADLKVVAAQSSPKRQDVGIHA